MPGRVARGANRGALLSAEEGNPGIPSPPDTVKFTPPFSKHLASALPLEGVLDVLSPKGFSDKEV